MSCGQELLDELENRTKENREKEKLSNRLLQRVEKTMDTCSECEGDTDSQRMDINTHDGTIFRIAIKWCKDCKRLINIEEH